MASKKKAVLLLDDAASHEGIRSTLRASGRHYRVANISEAGTWRDASSHFDDLEVTAVVGKFAVPALVSLGDHRYDRDADELFARIFGSPHMIFVSSGLLSGDAIREAEGRAAFVFAPDVRVSVVEVTLGNITIPRDHVPLLRRGVERLRDSRLRLFTYNDPAEVTVAAEGFLEESENGLLLRVYVPAGRMWGSETDKMLTLFRDFLVRVAQVEVRLDQVRTANGIIYAFYGDNVTPATVAEHFEEFTTVLDMSTREPELVEKLLKDRYELRALDITSIITRYAIEARRLRLDFRHERERKLLSMRQQFEAELSEVSPPVPDDEIDRLIQQVLPNALDIMPVARPALAFNVFNSSEASIFVRGRHMQRLESIVAREINGDALFTQSEAQLLDFIRRYGRDDARELTSSVYELKDASAPAPLRITAAQRLRTFLFRIGAGFPDPAMGSLHSYIEYLLDPSRTSPNSP